MGYGQYVTEDEARRKGARERGVNDWAAIAGEAESKLATLLDAVRRDAREYGWSEELLAGMRAIGEPVPDARPGDAHYEDPSP